MFANMRGGRGIPGRGGGRGRGGAGIQRAQSMKRPNMEKASSKRGLLQRTSSLSRMSKPQTANKKTESNLEDCVAIIEKDVERLTRGADYLMGGHEKNERAVAILTRNELFLGEVLGEGSFAQVFEIVQFELDEDVSAEMSDRQQRARLDIAANQVDQDEKPRYAIKHLSKRLLRKPKLFNSAAADMIVEGLYLAKLSHPNILKLRGVAKDGPSAYSDGQYDSFFLLTDKLTDTLDTRIQAWKNFSKNPSEKLIPRKTSYALQISNALQYLHDRRIIFRDLKPQNIGFKGLHQIQLFDFGLCRELPPEEDARGSDKLYMMSGAGTRRYMAVEIFLDRRYNLKADVYGMTMIYYEMLAQCKPFARFTKDEHQEFVCEGGERPPTDKLNLPDSVEQFLQDGWCQKISDRMTMPEAVDNLTDILNELTGGHAENYQIHDDEEDEPEASSVCSSLGEDSTGDFDDADIEYAAEHIDNLMDSKTDMTMMSMASNASATSRAFRRTIAHVRLLFKKPGEKDGDDENGEEAKPSGGEEK